MILLPWPCKELSPNTRCHWAVKAKAVKSYRSAAGWATKASGYKIHGNGPIDLHIGFYPPDNRARDLDGMLSSIKAGLDGIADALDVNDKRFTLWIERCAKIKGGEVRIIISG